MGLQKLDIFYNFSNIQNYKNTKVIAKQCKKYPLYEKIFPELFFMKFLTKKYQMTCSISSRSGARA